MILENSLKQYHNQKLNPQLNGKFNHLNLNQITDDQLIHATRGVGKVVRHATRWIGDIWRLFKDYDLDIGRAPFASRSCAHARCISANDHEPHKPSNLIAAVIN